jgi:hypothetical protein
MFGRRIERPNWDIEELSCCGKKQQATKINDRENIFSLNPAVPFAPVEKRDSHPFRGTILLWRFWGQVMWE